jgi:uncharacterized protein
LTERIEILDVVRGMALFGIIASNMRAFNGPMAAYFDHSLMWQGGADRVAQGFIDLFISGKFITLFSFLFGIGFAIQMDRAAARGLESQRFYLRRAAALVMFGLIHMFFIWWGDILFVYGSMAFLLYLFRKRSEKAVLAWSAALYAWPWVVSTAVLAASLAGMKTPSPPIPNAAELQRLINVYANGSYGQIFMERLTDNGTGAVFTVFYAPRLLGIFLFGMWVWRRGIVRSLAEQGGLLRRCRAWGLAAGLVLNAGMVAIAEIWHPDPAGTTPISWFNAMLSGVALPALSLGYASTLALAFQREAWRRWLRPFGAVGRTALTNYLMQSVLCTALYYGYGFGLYGKVGPLLGLAPTVAIYGAQVAMSTWWTRRFTYGPMEWIWRTLTYGRLSPARMAAVQG